MLLMPRSDELRAWGRGREEVGEVEADVEVRRGCWGLARGGYGCEDAETALGGVRRWLDVERRVDGW